MATNPYLNPTNNRAEQNLIEDILVEAIQFYGTDAFYISRNDQQEDLIYGEDPLKSFTKAYPIEVYNSNTTDYEGQKEIFSKFGIEIKNDYTILLARKTFRQRIAQETQYNRPKEGDLIFIPHVSLGGTLFEITWVEPDKDFFLMGRKPTFFYEMRLEPFKYSEEILNTGIEDIDSVALKEAYTIELQMGSGSGNYQISEFVYQGASYSGASATALVSNWNKPSLKLKIINIKGTFAANSTVIGQTSNSQYTLVSYDNLQNNLDRIFDNPEIRTEGTAYISFDESNPFGDP